MGESVSKYIHTMYIKNENAICEFFRYVLTSFVVVNVRIVRLRDFVPLMFRCVCTLIDSG